MNNFKEFGIPSPVVANHIFTGEKIKMNKILNREITVIAHKVTDSKYDGKCLHLQIVLGETRHVVFTGSKNLLEIIQKVPQGGYPFRTTIVETDDERFEFT